jgi:hypothetical protein
MDNYDNPYEASDEEFEGRRTKLSREESQYHDHV